MGLTILDVLGLQHCYGIARRIEQVSENLLAVSQGALYPILLKLEREGAIASMRGTSEDNRRSPLLSLDESRPQTIGIRCLTGLGSKFLCLGKLLFYIYCEGATVLRLLICDE